eukprot:1482053-Rhodomonas_salina.3
MAATLLGVMQEHGHIITEGFGAVGAAAPAEYWVNQNEKKLAKTLAVSAADMRAERAGNERDFAVSAGENEKKLAVAAADARADEAEHREFTLQHLVELGNLTEENNYMAGWGSESRS